MATKALSINTKKKRKEKLTPLTAVMLAVLIAYCVIMVALFAFAIITSLKDPAKYIHATIFPDKELYPYNFIRIFEVNITFRSSGKIVNNSLSMIVLNSVIYALGCGLVNTVVMATTAYLCASYKYKYSAIVYSVVIVVMAVPIVGSQAAELSILRALKLHDTWLGLIILKANFLGVYFLVFHEMFKSTPVTYREAAALDGANDWRVMISIYFPLAKSVFLTVFLLTFINYWNDYQTPILYAPSHPTLSRFLIEITRLSQDDFDSMPMQMATTVVLMIPPLTIFVAFQKKLLSNLTVGGIKG